MQRRPPTTTQVYRVWIKATPEAIWDAITKPEWTDRYGYGGIAEFDLPPRRAVRRPPGRGDDASSADVPDDIIDGEILEADPPRRLVDDLADADGPGHGGRGLHEAHATRSSRPRARARKLTVIHELEGAPTLASMVAGEPRPRAPAAAGRGSLSDLKSLLETGKPLAD